MNITGEIGERIKIFFAGFILRAQMYRFYVSG